ncbi:MAG: selenocysteine-specific translation elongation factor [Actinobacteria bacterium]|nr:selenocysteine-specific translation elongation factor [Actinomycetota bacterium]
MHVVATAGHVDHGKSTLVRALTGMEPDRWAEERRRGMTIDLGYAWAALPSGEVLGFVDVPGHQRFIGNMLAGLGPAPAVLVVVAADEGWRRQSGEHLAAVDALGLTHGLLVVTRSDLADPAAAMGEARDQVRGSSLGDVEAVAVSGLTGAGLPELQAALDRLVAGLPPAVVDGPVRLWLDRSFSVRGSGTVVTGTLGAGTLRVGDELELHGRTVRIRGLQSLGKAYEKVAAVARVAVNLRGVEREEVERGDALLTPRVWREVSAMDLRLSVDPRELPAELLLHVGSTAAAVRLRPLGPDTARAVLHRPLPLRAGDRALLRDPGRQTVAAGALVLDADPPGLRRRGAAAERGSALVTAGAVPNLIDEVARRGAVRRAELRALGVATERADGVVVHGDWLIAPARWTAWTRGLQTAVDAHVTSAPLEGGLPHAAASHAVGLPDQRLLAPLAAAAGLESAAGRLRRPGVVATLGAAEYAVAELEKRLAAEPMAAPDAPDLEALGLGVRELAAAERAGRLLRLRDDVVLLPDGPARAMRVLAGLPQPFTLSQARVALGTTRRVAVPLLEHLDSRGWTRRLDGLLREVRRPAR